MEAFADKKNNAKVREKARLTEHSLQEMYADLSKEAKEVVHDYRARIYEDEDVIMGEGNLEFLGASVRLRTRNLPTPFKKIPNPFEGIIVDYLKSISERYEATVTKEFDELRLNSRTPFAQNREQLEPLKNFIEHYAAILLHPKFQDVIDAFHNETENLSQRYVSKLESMLH